FASQQFILNQPIALKMTLASRPESVTELEKMTKEKFKIDFDFYIEELPQKAVLKLVRSQSDASSIASDDTIILPHAMTPERTQRWPDVCPVPAFSYEVELILVEGNLNHERTGKTLKLSRGQKHDILETLASKMHSFKAYPSDKDISVVAEALVTTHPCLKEPGTQTGWYGWKNSLKFKMGNFCTKLSRAGYSEVAVNSGKRSRNNPDKQSPHTDIKRPKRAEVNFLPNFPKGEDGSSLERQRLQIVDEVIRTDKNLPLIAKLMQTTFSLRRKEVINDDLPVGEILEFHRITNINLKNHFYSELDRHVPRLQSLFRKKAARTGKVSEVLDQLFNTYDRQVNELQIDNIPVGLLLISATSTDAAVFCPEKVAVVLEGNTVVDFPTFSDAFVMLFALIYGLHLSYPKDLANTFDFIQKVLMGLEDGKLKPRVLSLKNDLLSTE
uniref:Uncharacterized protein n=1 Tax=Labrus bergylta TaxID=56723 RepID=A0A3Q3L9J2_9LABR